MITCAQFVPGDPTWDAIVSQVGRFEGLEKFPFGVEGKRELCFALLTAESLDEAKFIVDRVVESETTERCPSPPDIRRMVAAERIRGEDTAVEIERDWKTQDFAAPPVLKQQLTEHLRLIEARQQELTRDPTLNRVGPDGRKVRTALRDELEAATRQLR